MGETPHDTARQEQAATVLVLVRDLMFAGRIGATARAAGVPVTLLREPAQLAATSSGATRLIVDLNQPGAIDAAAAWKGGAGREVVGFVSHVDAETIARARAAGIQRILPRSRFVEVLPELLKVEPSSS